MIDDHDAAFLRRAIQLAAQARKHGNRPFGALIVDGSGNAVAEAENNMLTSGDCTRHGEINALRLATPKLSRDELAKCTLYVSAEPCAMCAAAIFWSNVRRVVFGVDAETLRRYRGNRPDQMDLRMSCRDVFRASPHEIKVFGPELVAEALVPHEGYWKA